MIVKNGTPHHRQSIFVALAVVVLAIGLLSNRAAGQEDVKEAEPQATKGGNLEALFLSERRHRQLSESRLRALQIAASVVQHRTRNRMGMLEFSYTVELRHADGWNHESSE